MKIELTGAYVETLSENKHYVVYKEQIISCFPKKSSALALAYDQVTMERMLRNNNKKYTKNMLTEP